MNSEAKIVSAVGIVVVLLVGGVSFFALRSASSDGVTTANATAANLSDAGQLVREDSPVRGAEAAPITVVEFADFQCPACRSAEPSIQQLLSDYDGRIKLVYRFFPLPMHQHGQLATNAALSAKSQGKFWEMHDKLFETQSEWSGETSVVSNKKAIELFTGYAQELGLNTETFKNEISSRSFASTISRDLADVNALGVSATPTFYVNGKQISGGVTQVKQAIDAALAQ